MTSLLTIAAGNLTGLLPTLGYAALFTLLRFVFYKGAAQKLRRTKDSKGVLFGPQLIEKVQEEGYATFGGVVLLACGLYALSFSDKGTCGFTSTSGCLDGWPADGDPRTPEATQYYGLEIGWYLHYLVKHELGIGMQDNLQMHIHHFSTLTLLLISFCFNLHRMGMLVVTLLNISNPFLHIAKVTHYLEFGALDKLAFLSFAVVFFLTRIVAYPFVILKGSLWDSCRVHPAFLKEHLPVYLVTNILLGVLLIMQLNWMHAIVRLLTKSLFGKEDDFKAESKQVDYARTKHEVVAEAVQGAAKDE